LFDSSKVSGFGLHSFTPSTDITAMYTDDGATSEFVDQWRDLGVPLTTVPVSAADARVVEIGVAAPNRRQQRVRQQQRASP
jgi:hypothetical protein